MMPCRTSSRRLTICRGLGQSNCAMLGRTNSRDYRKDVTQNSLKRRDGETRKRDCMAEKMVYAEKHCNGKNGCFQ